MTDTRHADAVVIGAGFGGIGAAMTLAEAGADVVVLEAMSYPGGCASTFRRGGHEFESGATVLTGFGPNQLFGRWIARHAVDVDVQPLDPVMTLHARGRVRPVPADKAAWVGALVAEAGDLGPSVQAFFATQQRVADSLWAVLDEPSLLPPLNGRAVALHAARAPRHLAWVRWLGQSLEQVLVQHGVSDFLPLRDWIEATVRVTVQSSIREVEAPFAMAALDFPFRGVAHIPGGIGTLCDGLLGAIRGLGGEVHLSSAVWSIKSLDNQWQVTSRAGTVVAPLVFANLLPSALGQLVGQPIRPELDSQIQKGWGAVMQYLLVSDEEGGPGEACHHQVVRDSDKPLEHGNHILVSVGSPQVGMFGPVRPVTVSTHYAMCDDPTTRASRVQEIQTRMLQQVERAFPSWDIRSTMPASPRTFQRFTGRPGGFVGGIPRHVGLSHYRSAFAGAVLPGLYLVGDSVFPGQSTLACATGGQRAVARAFADVGWTRGEGRRTA